MALREERDAGDAGDECGSSAEIDSLDLGLILLKRPC
jgi:hypothetical protein